MKELQEDIKELLQKIIVKAYEISNNTDYKVAVDFSGNSNAINMYYFKEKEIEKLTMLVDTIYLNTEDTKEKLQEALQKLEELEG